jgi:HSP20 family protein
MVVEIGFPGLLDDLLQDFVARDLTGVSSGFPAIDVAEHENEFVLVAEMPGVKNEDLKISVEDSVLTLSGRRKPYEIPQDAKVLLNEMRVREFSRSIRLPKDIELDKISAELRNGMLRIAMPKAERARVRNIEVR